MAKTLIWVGALMVSALILDKQEIISGGGGTR